MAILTPVNITHNNPELPTVYFSDVKGNIWATGSDGNQYGIPEGKRELGMIVYFSSSQDFKYYKGGTTASADWSSPLSWSMFGGGETYSQGPGIIIDESNYISASLGAGLEFDDNDKIQAKVRQVNGEDPINGNVAVSLTAVLTGPSASDQGGGNNLVLSSSGAATGSIANATVWIVSGDTSTPSPNGLAYIFISQSVTAGGYGEWLPLSYINQTSADIRYIRKSPDGGASEIQPITSSLNISGSSVTFSSSLFWSGASDLGGATNNVLVLGSNGQIYKTGSYGSGGGATPGGVDTTIQFNDGGSSLSGSGNFTFNKITNVVNLNGSLIATGSTILSSSLQVIGTTRITGSLIVSSSSQIIGTETITGSLIVSSSSNVIGTSRVTGSLIVSNSLSVVGTGSISGSLIVSRSTDNTAIIVGSGSANPLLNVLGSQGQLFSVYDTLTGSLFSVNDISGLPILEVKSDVTTLIGSYQAPALHTSRRVVSTVGDNIIYNGIPTSSYNAAIIDYNLTSASYAKVGSIMTAWSSSTITTQTEYATASVAGGNYPTMSLQISGANLIITASAASANWVIKTIIRSI